MPVGSLYLQPGEERRKSGSHYTPRSLTGPIVRTTLRPVLEALGEHPTPAQILELKICDPAMGSGAFLVEAARQLGEHLRRAWDLHKCMPAIPPDEDPDLHARRLVAQTCLYGVDKNPFAVDLAKLSLWLVTLAKDHPFTFLDHALKHGDSLVGLNKGQIAEFRWDHETRLHGPLFEHMRQQVGKASALRREIHRLGDEQDAAKRSTLKSADDAIHEARIVGDAAISAYFSEENDKKRNQRREEIYKETVQPAQKGDARALNRLEQLSQALRSGEKPVSPFHWEIEFPEVFDRENPGFDCFVGNPPFMGGTMISTRISNAYLEFLSEEYPGSGNRMDLAAYFFRRCYQLVPIASTLGLVGTNTISQGDTRSGGLRWITHQGGTIYAATKRYQWPGTAAVIVSIVHIRKGPSALQPVLNGAPTPAINSYLLPGSDIDDPRPLNSNENIAFEGVKPYGDGFLFEDGNEKASPIASMNEILDRHPSSRQVISPYIGGAELNSTPTLTASRHIINFGDFSEAEAQKWPDLLKIVREKVRPERLTKAKDVAAWPYWQFWRTRQQAFSRARLAPRMLATARVSNSFAFAFLPSSYSANEKLIIFALSTASGFCILQSRGHELWVRLFGSSLKDDLNYTSTCFETFPFPPDWQHKTDLERTGERYYTFRAELMVRNNEGLTTTYNRFHDPDEQDPDILNLRELHGEMDRAVLTAYGWSDLAERATCEFRLDYEDDDEPTDEDAPRARTKKKPWRYRWPQDFHDEVLARLLDLNQQRAEQERLTGLAAATAKPTATTAKKSAKKTGKRASKASSATQATLLPPDDD